MKGASSHAGVGEDVKGSSVRARGALATIGGHDPVSGAGITADVAVFRAWGFHPLSVLTSVIAQNTGGVRRLWPLERAQIEGPWQALLDDVKPMGVKIGALGGESAVDAVVSGLEAWRASGGEGPVVLDPVLASGQNGRSLGGDALASAVRSRLLRHVDLLTPNVPEVASLTGRPLSSLESVEGLLSAGESLLAKGPGAVLLKGGHLPALGGDVLLCGGAGQEARPTHYPVERRYPYEVRGTGCHLSSALCAALAQGASAADAVSQARAWLDELWASGTLSLGRGARVFDHAR